jgi:hypothetical protein
MPRAADLGQPQWYSPVLNPSVLGQYQQQQHRAEEGRTGSGGEDDDSMFWAAGMMLVIIGANVLALLCELNMDADQSLLRGLGTANGKRNSKVSKATNDETNTSEDEGLHSADDGQSFDGYEPPSLGSRQRRRATKRIVHWRW